MWTDYRRAQHLGCGQDSLKKESLVKKHLMAGTALVAATMLAAGGAAAQDKKMSKPSISVNGYYSVHMSGIVDDDANTVELNAPGVDVRSDSEVQFNGRAALDNGMKIHVRWELEGNTHTRNRPPDAVGKPSPANGDDQIDEVYVTVSGSFGRIILGSTDNAAVKMLTGMTGAWATNVGQNFHFNSQEWIPSAVGTPGGVFHVLHDARIREHGGGGDSEKISYISPKFGGFQAGASYIPYAEQDLHTTHDIDDGRHDGMAGAVSYSAKVGDVGAAVGAGWSSMQGAGSSDDLNEWVIAGRLDFGGGFRVAVAHQQTTSGTTGHGAIANRAGRGAVVSLKGSVTEAGVRYVVGPNAFSLVGSYGELEDTSDQYTAAKAAYRRTLGAGVFWDANLFVNRSENNAGEENAGSVVTTGLTLVF